MMTEVLTSLSESTKTSNYNATMHKRKNDITLPILRGKNHFTLFLTARVKQSNIFTRHLRPIRGYSSTRKLPF